jgi:hypothetical protein
MRWVKLALAGLTCSWMLAPAPASAADHQKQVRYRGYAIKVPAAWPVYRLAAEPRRCVRFDRRAVYLGRPSPEQRCPAHAVGRSEAILIEPLRGAAVGQGSANTIRLPGRRVAPRSIGPGPYGSAAPVGEVGISVPAAGVYVTATWRRHREVVEGIVRGARRAARARGALGASRTPRAQRLRFDRRTATASVASYYTGLGFDACSAPSTTTLAAWLASPYRAVGVYIGGINRACSQPNLTSTWVASVLASGWVLIPTYVGLQAPADNCGCASINPAQATAQGVAAADDAIAQAAALGIGPGNPIYFDMEGYATGGANTSAVLTFLEAWTARLQSRGYFSGVYGSASSTISDLVDAYGPTYLEPDAIWIARWDGLRTTADIAVPATYWSNHQRLKQYRGGHNETYGGVTINIDNNYLDGPVVGVASRPVLLRRRCDKVIFRRRPRSVALRIRTINVLHCGKARKVAMESRYRRYMASGGDRRYRKLRFVCEGSEVGELRVAYRCRFARKRVKFVRKG